jgi:hypothetical protein
MSFLDASLAVTRRPVVGSLWRERELEWVEAFFFNNRFY